MTSPYLYHLNPSFDHPIIHEMKAYALSHHIPIMQDEGMHLLVQLLNIHHAKKVLEIGTAIGYSSLCMALFSDAKIISIERDENMYQLAKDYIHRSEMSERVRLILADANEVELNEMGFDVIFIDAAKASYIRFFEKYSQYLRAGGIIISDNLLFRGQVENPEKIEGRNRKQLVNKIDRYNHFLVNHPDFDSYIYAIGDGISISIKK
jgi:predicted O-methyltransferase YrrM